MSIFRKLQLKDKTGIAAAGAALIFLSGPLWSSGTRSDEGTAAVPDELTPPSGNVLFLSSHGSGTQNYICLPSANGGSNSWVFFSPQATLSARSIFFHHSEHQVATHFLSPVPGVTGSPEPGCTLSSETGEVSCPTWQSSGDSSAVWGSKITSITAGSDQSCRNTGAIPCLLLKAVANRSGKSPVGVLTKTTYVQRLNTQGGSAPLGSCQAGDQALVPYSADYLFYTTDHENPGEKRK
jgi:hypothetical protein